MNRTSSKHLASFTTTQALQLLLNDSDSDENGNSEDSKTEYEGHLTEVSEHSDVEAAVATNSPTEERTDSNDAEAVSDTGRC